ncbi:MAG: adenylyltransferase/cytidyltransferase family protein [Gammaproteobacteria bacterium]|nr:adenylyltransferase/cytidyltransferase family protein [Gammaproteobacteria bacterium]
MSSDKIADLDTVGRRSAAVRLAGKKVVHCHGTFDLMHAGHIRHLQRAATLGDLLVVTLTADRFVNKGPERPVFNQELRAGSLAALACVDLVAISDEATGMAAIEAIRPDYYVKGGEYRHPGDDVTGNIAPETALVKQYGGEIRFTEEITFSSTKLLNDFFGLFPEETREYLGALRQDYRPDEVITMIRGLSQLRVLVLGDAIIDEYHYTSPLGQTGKGNVLSVRYDSGELFAGGAMAVANHLSGFVQEVTLVTALGTKESFEPFIRSRLQANVEPHFFYRDDDQTLVKRRFVDPDMAKLFEVYLYGDRPLPATTEQQVLQWLEQEIEHFDLVLVPDFGNGFITAAMVERLGRSTPFLAVNTQINSGNRGFHAITRYPRADFISLNEPELRLASHDRSSDLETLAAQVMSRLGAQFLTVTRGTRGVLFNRKEGGNHTVPALSTSVVDRIGAGDAFLSLAALALAGGLPDRLCSFIGSAAAALEVQTVCNREPVGAVALYKYIGTLLK